MDTSIAIRTLLLSGDRMHLQVGGAVVADSDPESEYAETLARGRLERARGRAEGMVKDGAGVLWVDGELVPASEARMDPRDRG